MDKDLKAALRLVAEAQRLASLALSPDTTARVTIRTATGEYLSDIPLSFRAAEALADAVGTVADYAEAMPDDFANGGQQPPADPASTIDPLLEADLEEYCIGLDTNLLVSMNPAEAVAAFDEVTGYGEQL